MKDLEQLKEKYINRHASMLGFEQPEGFSEQSRVLIKKKLNKTKQNTSVFSVRALFGTVAIAASLLLLFTLNLTPDTETTVASETMVEDVFVTSFLLDTLLLEEEVLDQVIQESLLDNFEENLALN
jgi:hypothetical protein